VLLLRCPVVGVSKFCSRCCNIVGNVTVVPQVCGADLRECIFRLRSLKLSLRESRLLSGPPETRRLSVLMSVSD